MANFLKAYEITNLTEGLHGNDPDDRGGETYMGIARNRNPSWVGWELIDQMKSVQGRLEPVFSADDIADLAPLHRSFFKFRFWDRLCGDLIDSQLIANEVYDSAVNVGVYTAVRWLQVALNAANKRERLYPDITVDRVIGPITLSAIEYAVKCGRERLVYRMQNTQQGSHYLTLMLSDPTQEKFAGGWFARTV